MLRLLLSFWFLIFPFSSYAAAVSPEEASTVVAFEEKNQEEFSWLKLASLQMNRAKTAEDANYLAMHKDKIKQDKRDLLIKIQEGIEVKKLGKAAYAFLINPILGKNSLSSAKQKEQQILEWAHWSTSAIRRTLFALGSIGVVSFSIGIPAIANHWLSIPPESVPVYYLVDLFSLLFSGGLLKCVASYSESNFTQLRGMDPASDQVRSFLFDYPSMLPIQISEPIRRAFTQGDTDSILPVLDALGSYCCDCFPWLNDFTGATAWRHLRVGKLLEAYDIQLKKVGEAFAEVYMLCELAEEMH